MIIGHVEGWTGGEGRLDKNPSKTWRRSKKGSRGAGRHTEGRSDERGDDGGVREDGGRKVVRIETRSEFAMVEASRVGWLDLKHERAAWSARIISFSEGGPCLDDAINFSLSRLLPQLATGRH